MTYLLLALGGAAMMFAPETFFTDYKNYTEVALALLIALIITPWVKGHLEE